MRFLCTLAAAGVFGVPAVHAQHPAERSSWDLQVGVASITSPAYPGADQHRLRVIPLLSVEYREILFAGQSRAGLDVAAGAYLLRSSTLRWTVELGSYRPRSYREADALSGMDPMHTQAYAGTGAAYTLGPVEATATVAAAIKEPNGVLATLGVASGLMLSPRWLLRFGTSAVFADGDNAAFSYGVTDEEASRRHALLEAGDARLRAGDDRAFRPRSGLTELSADVGLLHPVSDRMSVLAFGRLGQLQGDAAASPLTRRRTTFSSGAGVVYRFAGR